MRLRTALIATAFALSSGAAFAACPEGQVPDKNTTAGIAKDGTHAPLETPDSTAKANPVQKDGKTMPLANQSGGGNQNLATSQQDVEAQQQGEKTAAATADETCVDKPVAQ